MPTDPWVHPPGLRGQHDPRRRRRPRRSYELFGCGWHGHQVVGADVAEIRPEDAALVREAGGVRWLRCLRCDAWLATCPPASPARRHLPDREQLQLPVRGRPLRDRYVLRLIALDRAVHFLVLSLLAAAVLIFATHENRWRTEFLHILTDLQSGVGGPLNTTHNGVLHELSRLFAISTGNLYITGVALAGYAVLEGVEAVGLWLARRWAEYLTFLATALLVPLEVYEISRRVTALKALTLAINLAIVAYLLVAKRLFGLRGGGRAEHAIRQRDMGWPAVIRATPPPALAPAATARLPDPALPTGPNGDRRGPPPRAVVVDPPGPAPVAADGDPPGTTDPEADR